MMPHYNGAIDFKIGDLVTIRVASSDCSKWQHHLAIVIEKHMMMGYRVFDIEKSEYNNHWLDDFDLELYSR